MGAASWFSGAGAVAGAAGALAIGAARAKAARFNAKIARQNAGLAREQAKRELSIAKEAGRRQIGSLVANIGASGLTSEGSFNDILVESARNIKRDQMNITYQGELRARGYEIQAHQATQQGKLDMLAGYFGAAASLLSGGAQAAQFSNTKSASSSSAGSSVAYNYQGGGQSGVTA